MKRISCIVKTDINIGTEEKPEIKTELRKMIMFASEDTFAEAYKNAQAESYNGEVTVEDIENPITEPTQLDMIEAQVAYTAMMTNTLLE